MISSTTVIRVTVGGEVVVSDPPSVLSFNESNDTQDNLSSFSNESLETTRDIVSDPGGCFVVTSECDHYHQRTFHNVSSAVSCRACVEQFLPQKISLDSSPPHVSQGVPHWVHVFAKSTASTSLRTQCASIAHNLPTISSSAENNRKRRLRNKFKKQQRLLH